MSIDSNFVEACKRYRLAQSKFTDRERLGLYALYKQATVGDAPARLPAYVALLKGAGHASWQQLHGMSKDEAMIRYAQVVNSCEPTLGSGEMASTGLAETSQVLEDDDLLGALSGQLVSKPLSNMTRQELVNCVEALRAQVQKLSVGFIVKEGELMRYRETVTGGDWSLRWYQVVPGWLRCYRSRATRELRLEVSLTQVVAVEAEPQERTRCTLRIDLNSPAKEDLASSRIAHLTQLRLSSRSKEERDAWIKAIATAARAAGAPLTTLATKTAMSGVRRAKSAPRGPFRAVHRVSRPSLLSTDATEPQSFSGFVNLVGVIAVVTNVRAFLNEWRLMPIASALLACRRGGERYRTGLEMIVFDAFTEVLLGLSVVAAAVVTSFVTERAAAACEGRYAVADAAFNLIHIVCGACSLLAPIVIVVQAPPRPLIHAALLCACTVAWMKHVSWAHTNAALRRRAWAHVASDSGASLHSGDNYPNNLAVSDLVRFFLFPTLVYQTDYPRTSRVRKRWLAKRLFELAVVVTLMLLIVTQFVAPTVESSLSKVGDLDLPQLLERLLALAIPNIAVWLLLFVAVIYARVGPYMLSRVLHSPRVCQVFELWLSILAELTRFGDRLFYRDWWNSSKFDEYWRLWNLPVHNFLVRHAYFPALDMGFSKTVATLYVFFLSASLHEVLVSVPCHVVKFWVFGAMMAQMPLIALTNWIARKVPAKSRLGNVLFWVTFCVVGQPMCIMLYSQQFFSMKPRGDNLIDPTVHDKAVMAEADDTVYATGAFPSNISYSSALDDL